MEKLFFILIFFSSFVQGQVSQQWVARYNNNPTDSVDVASDLVIDKSGNSYVTGWSASVSSGFDITTIKYDQNGNQNWIRKYNGITNQDDFGYSIILDSLDNIYVTGNAKNDVVTLKYDSSGNLQWTKLYNSASVYNFSYVKRIEVDNSLNVYVAAGDFNGNAIIIKYNSLGIQKWVGTYNYFSFSWATCLLIDPYDNIYFTGKSDNSINDDDLFIAKLDSNGILKWTKRYDGGFMADDFGSALAYDNSSNSIYVTGASGVQNNISLDFVTIKYDSSGTQQWVKRYNGLGNDNDQAFDIKLDNQKNIYVTGYSYGVWIDNDYTLVKYNSSGSQIWVATYDNGGQDYSNSIALDSSCNIYVFGSSNGPSSTSIDQALVKFDSTGQQDWFVRYNGTGSYFDQGYVVALDDNLNIYTTGYSYGINSLPDFVTIKYSQINGLPLEAINNSTIQFSPNPFSSETTVQITSYELRSMSFQFDMYDVFGRVVKQFVTRNSSFVIERGNLPSGIYFYKVSSENKVLGTGKVIIG